MAYSKIILNGETLMDVTSDTVVAGSMTSGTTATKKDGTKITGTIVTKSAADLTASGSTVTVPGGYYSAQATKNVASTTHPNPTAAITSSTGVVTATHTQTAGYVAAGTTTSTVQLTSKAAATYNTSTADQTVASYRWLTGTQTIKSVTTSNLTAANIASGVVVKVGDANNASRITQVTGTYAPAVSSATITPTETAQTLNATGVYGYKPVTINAISSTYVGTGVAKKSSADTTFASATGTFTAPIGYYSAAATKTLTTQAAQTIYPSTADQTVASYRWLTGTQTFKSVTTTNLTAANIASGVVVKVGDSGNASRIAQITGTYAGAGGYNLMLLTNGNYDPRGGYNYYVKVSGNTTSYYSAGDVTNFNSGNIITVTNTIYASKSVYLDGSLMGSGTTVSFSAPSYPLHVKLTNGGTFFTKAIPSGTLNITTNGTYDVYNYISASVSVSVSTPVLSYYSAYKILALDSTAYDMNNTFVNEWLSTLSIIPSYQFAGRYFNGTVSFPNVTQVGSYAFTYPIDAPYSIAANNRTMIFPKATSFYYGAFMGNPNISVCEASMLNNIGSYCFSFCRMLNSVNFPSCDYIGSFAFRNCSRLISFYLMGNYVPILEASTVFSSTPIGGYSTIAGRYGSIYVPESLYTEYENATGWAYFANAGRIVSV